MCEKCRAEQQAKQNAARDRFDEISAIKSQAHDAHKAVERLEQENNALRESINRLGDANTQLHTLLHKYADQALTAKKFAMMLAADLQPKG